MDGHQRLRSIAYFFSGWFGEEKDPAKEPFKLAGLSKDYKKSFSTSVINQACHVAWDNIYTNRIAVAHGNGAVMMNLNDLKKDYAESMKVIDELVKALCLRPKDIKGLN